MNTLEDNKVYILYCGDDWLTKMSLTAMGIFSSVDKAIQAFKRNTRSSHIDDMVKELRQHKQTCGYDENWMIVPCNLNEFGEVI